MRRTRDRLSAVLLVAGLMLGSTGGAATARENLARPMKPQRAATTTTKKVKIIDFAFSPKTITISKGTRVRWTNTGSVGHTSTSNTGKWDSGTIAAGDSFSRVFKKAGTFLYHCSIHSSMKGKIIVA
jgi:plastocyanin